MPSLALDHRWTGPRTVIGQLERTRVAQLLQNPSTSELFSRTRLGRRAIRRRIGRQRRRRTDGDGDRRARARRAPGPAGGGAQLEPARGLAPGIPDPRRRRRGPVPRQPVRARRRTRPRAGRGDRPHAARDGPGPVRDGLAADLPALRLCGRELRQAARGDAAVPLPAMPQRLRGGDGRLHRDLLQRLAADLRHPLPVAGDARPVRLHLPLPRRARGPPPERRALHRIHPRSAAWHRVRGAARLGQLRVRCRARPGQRHQRRHRGRLLAADRRCCPSPRRGRSA